MWFTEGIEGAGNRALTTINWNWFYCCLYFFFYCVKVLTCKLPVNLGENIQTWSQKVSFQVFWKESITVNVFKRWCSKAELKWPVHVLEEISFLKSVLSYATILLAYLSTRHICIWKITKLKLTTSWSHSGFQRSIGTIMSFCCKYLKSEMIRCVGSFTSCDLARSKRLKTSKDSQSILLISPGAKSAI